MIDILVMIFVLVLVVCSNLIAIVVANRFKYDIHSSAYWFFVFGWPVILVLEGISSLENLSKEKVEAPKAAK